LVDNLAGFGEDFNVKDALFIPFEQTFEGGIHKGKTGEFFFGEPDDGTKEGGEVIDIAAIGEDGFEDIVRKGRE
jgi:hypothetical protein